MSKSFQASALEDKQKEREDLTKNSGKYNTYTYIHTHTHAHKYIYACMYVYVTITLLWICYWSWV